MADDMDTVPVPAFSQEQLDYMERRIRISDQVPDPAVGPPVPGEGVALAFRVPPCMLGWLTPRPRLQGKPRPGRTRREKLSGSHTYTR